MAVGRLVPLLVVIVLLSVAIAYKSSSNKIYRLPKSVLKSTTSSSSTSWQEDLDQILDVDTSCTTRRDLTRTILRNKLMNVREDLRDAIQKRNVEKIAPPSLSYGKAFVAFQAFQKQLVSDVIPDFLTNVVPKIIDEGPKALQTLPRSNPEDILKNAKKVLENINELRTDPSRLQSTLDDIERELKNIVKSEPLGLEQPSFEVLSSTETYEIRKYAPYTICTTTMRKGDTMDVSSDITESGMGFNRLAGYIFGDNDKDGVAKEMVMTTPVITDTKSMSFVLPKMYNATTAPIPKESNIELQDVIGQTVAVKTFTGLVTEGEISRQKAMLEDSLISARVVYDSTTFRVFQYNPPYTLPWVRKNEIAVNVMMPDLEPSAKVEVVTATVGDELMPSTTSEGIAKEATNVSSTITASATKETDTLTAIQSTPLQIESPSTTIKAVDVTKSSESTVNDSNPKDDAIDNAADESSVDDNLSDDTSDDDDSNEDSVDDSSDGVGGSASQRNSSDRRSKKKKPRRP